MSKKLRGFLLGFCYGFILTFACTIIMTVIPFAFGGAGGSDYLQGWFWNFSTLSIPFSISFAISGYFSAYETVSRFKFGLICCIIGYLNVLFMGTVGAILIGGFDYGFANINMKGYLEWGPIYALIFLPISALLVAWFLKGLQKALNYTSSPKL